MQPVQTHYLDNLANPEVEDDEDDLDDLEDFTNELQEMLRVGSDPNKTLSMPIRRVKKDLEKIERDRVRLFKEGSKFAAVDRKDIVGIDSVLEQVDGVINWLKHYKVYTTYNARPEPGVLFAGRPGTGKTYTSRYIASASGALFVDVRDFPYPGMTAGAKDIKALFRFARETHQKTGRPIILFWDEFESYAGERRGQNAQQASVVSQLTAELDGICGKPAGILLIGCTNYFYNIDGALKRPGRMGLQVEFNAPSRTGKKILLEHYVNKINAEKIDYDVASYYFNDSDVAATLEEAVQEAWSLAVKRWVTGQKKSKEPVLTESELLDTFLDRLVGPPPAYVERSSEAQLRTAIHETGHALAAILKKVPLRLVTIRPGKHHLGKTMTHTADPMTSDLQEYQNIIRVMVAGPVAEEVLGIGRQAGAESDTQQATDLARHLVDSEGFGSKTGMFNPTGVGRSRSQQDVNPSLSEGILTSKDEDVLEILEEAKRDVKNMFVEFGSKKIEKLARKLVKTITLTGKEFNEEVEKLGGN